MSPHVQQRVDLSILKSLMFKRHRTRKGGAYRFLTLTQGSITYFESEKEFNEKPTHGRIIDLKGGKVLAGNLVPTFAGDTRVPFITILNNAGKSWTFEPPTATDAKWWEETIQERMNQLDGVQSPAKVASLAAAAPANPAPAAAASAYGFPGVDQTSTFEHCIAGSTSWSAFSTEHSALIAAAMSVALDGAVGLPGLPFEVRWGSQATSTRMASSTTGIMQVNTNNNNTRLVRAQK